MPTRIELQRLANLRIEEAEALFAAQLYAGSYYLAGYAVELALKACICRVLELADYLENELERKAFKTHKLDDLILLAGLRAELKTVLNDRAFARNWGIANDWSPEGRYIVGQARSEARDLIDAVGMKDKGVLAWLSSRW